ncbi:MAG: DUF805 domain-containing protein [Rhizobacter sp.]|nr:DUF805 domain-containing protein [Rhizobacter sp.]
MEGEAQVRLVFAGEVLDGFQLVEVKRRFGEAFKIEGTRLAAMFSGERTVLKRALPAGEGARYVAKLAALGARIHIEPLEAAKPAPAAPTAPALAAAVIPALAPLTEEITCPNCGERQPRQVFCRACTTDMPRGIAAKKEDADRARAERLDAARAGGRYAPPRAAGGVVSSGGTADPPPLLSLSFEGRLGRISYFNAGALAWVGIALIGIMAALLLPMFRSMLLLIPVGIAGIVFVLWSLRVTALRLHDFNFSGWWGLLTLIPYLGFVATLVLLAVPGSDDDNDYGEKPRQGNGLVAVVILIVSAVAMLVLVRVAMSSYGQYSERASRQATAQSPTGADPATLQRAAQYLSSPAALDAYATYAREPNQKAFAVGGGGAFGWHAGQASQREAMSRALSACDANRQPYTSECRLVNVNGAWPKEE